LNPHEPTRSRWHHVAAALVLVAASYAFRLPPLLNARSTNSDAAIVGLQAMHILRGERSAFLWGSGYQTSVDAWVAAAWFKIAGPTPVALMLSSLTLHVVATLLVFAVLRRRFSPWIAALLTMPFVVSPSSVHSYALYPPRQAALTLAVAALWALSRGDRDREDEGDEPRSWGWLIAGGALATLAIGADPYPLLLLPVAALYALFVAWSAGDSLKPRLLRFGGFALGAAIGLVPFILLRRHPGARGGPMGLTTSMLGHHYDLLLAECLPWALSYKVYFARNVMNYRPWEAPLAFRVLGIVGALLVVWFVLYAFIAPFMRAIPAAVRRLGFAAAVAYPLALVGFLVSVMVMDHFSMRYLVVLTLMLPFAATPFAYAAGKRLPLFYVPHLLAAAIAGWVGYGPFVRGPLPVRETPELKDDYTLFHMLRARGLRYAMADYWASYRLTFLFREEIVVVPTNAAEDRHAPYRRAFDGERVYAYVFDPGRSREDLAEKEKELAAANESVEKLAAGRLTVLVVTRGTPRPPAPTTSTTTQQQQQPATP